jgi:hypothetical protein
MYRFQILAYEAELNNPDMPGVLSKATEIIVTANSTADALNEARTIYIAKNYFIKSIHKLDEQKAVQVVETVVREPRRKKAE